MSVRLDTLFTVRTAAGISVTELARAANVSVWTVTQLETGGTCSEDEAGRLAAALSVSLAALGQQELS